MKSLRFGIVGLGAMGAHHAKLLQENSVPRATLAAVCDVVPDLQTRFPGIPCFEKSEDMIRSGTIDALLIATPHYSHTTIGMDALAQGLHVLVEKPISVHKADCERLISVPRRKGQLFGAMFNQRTDPYFQKLRQMIQDGELGEVRRINWIITNWFRTHAYYNSGGWRATWAGEGGGVLLNQCPHNLDLWQWIFGMPRRVQALCAIGRYHDIEVEDDVTALLEYDSGTTGVFITSTGESPGTNRLEVTAERGRVVIENDTFKFTRNEVPMSEFSVTSELKFNGPPVWEVSIPSPGHGEQHLGILKNFTEAALDGVPLLAPAEEGIHSVELANAMLYSSFQGAPVDLPLDAVAYEAKLKDATKASKFVKKAPQVTGKDDFSSSFR